jgi:hypothetical protein
MTIIKIESTQLSWYLDDVLHRQGGPARITSHDKQYWLHGQGQTIVYTNYNIRLPF